VSYRLYECADYLRPYPAFADCPDFDRLRRWAVESNDWKGQRARAVIVSDEGRFWYVDRRGVPEEVSAVRGWANRPSQVERLTMRLEGRTHRNNLSLVYTPPCERWHHKTIHVGAK
jgi:hypothetical protein